MFAFLCTFFFMMVNNNSTNINKTNNYLSPQLIEHEKKRRWKSRSWVLLGTCTKMSCGRFKELNETSTLPTCCLMSGCKYFIHIQDEKNFNKIKEIYRNRPSGAMTFDYHWKSIESWVGMDTILSFKMVSGEIYTVIHIFT